MPSYEYRCKGCGHEFLEILTISEYESYQPRCPKCQGTEVERVLSSFFAKTSRKS